MTTTAQRPGGNGVNPLIESLVLTPMSRRPTRLADATSAAILAGDVLSVAMHSRAVEIAKPEDRDDAVSVVIATVDNLLFLMFCVTSLLANTRRRCEIIVVDNGSRDGTADYLDRLARTYPNVRTIRNAENRGFAAATNQGLAAASGNTLVLLNDDTVVPPDWCEGLARHLADPRIGLLGPVTNRAGNDSQIDTAYHTYGEFVRFACERRADRDGTLRDLPMLTMFCLAMRRDVYERLGPLDERFEMGMFEDDDYAMRAHEAGYRIVCADDVFVHHYGATSLGKATIDFGALLERNRRKFEQKWGIPWTPHQRQRSATYQDQIERIRAMARNLIGAVPVAVISRGDDALIDLPGCDAWHFPRLENGDYAGCHPTDSDEAIRQLEAVCAAGAGYLLIPEVSRWWLQFYEGLQQRLTERHRLVVNDDAFVLFDLRPSV